jgi:phosphohistidine phosphatase
VTSPLLRARQTAEAILRHWGPDAPQLRETDLLAPGGKHRKAARYLRELEGESVAVVGHQPDLGELVGWFIGSRKAQVDLAKGGVACVVFDGPPRKGSGYLAWLLTPEWLDDGVEAEVKSEPSR